MRFQTLHTLLVSALMLLCILGGEHAQAQHRPALDPAKAITQYDLDIWTTDDDLPQASITSLVQTRDGYLWMGTQEGLVRFDGLRFKVFDKRGGSLDNNYVSALLEDQQGTLWIGTRGGGLVRYQDGAFTTFTVADGLSSNHISSLLEDAHGSLWIGTFDGGVTLYDGRQFDKARRLVMEEINTIYQDREDRIWIGTREHGLVRFENHTFSYLTTSDGLPSNDVTAFIDAPDGRFLIGTRDKGLASLSGERFIALPEGNGLPPSISSLYVDAARSLWVGTRQGGLCRLEGSRFACLNAATERGLAHNDVLSLLQDREGNLWVGTDGGGLHRLRDGKFINFTTAEGLAHDAATTVYEDAAGALWIGTEGGGVSRLKSGRITTFTTRDGLAHDVVYSIYGTQDGTVWIGTAAALNSYANGRITTFTTQDGLPEGGAYALYEDSRGNLWVAMNGLVRMRNGQVTAAYTTEDGLSSNLITSIAEDESGRLWVGTFDGGLNLLVDGKVQRTYTTEDGLGSNLIIALHPDADGTLWFSTREGGLSRIRDGRLTTYTAREDGLYNDNITWILEDDQGRLWMSSNRGLFVLSKRDFDRYDRGEITVLEPTVYDKADGLRTMEFWGGTQPAGWRTRDGVLWFPTLGAGIAGIHPDHIATNQLPPLVVIEKATADGRAIPRTGTAELQPGQGKIDFEYVGLSLRAPEKVEYQFMLEGYDSDWVDGGTRREMTYTNLDPGSYTFKVRARNNDGVWSTEAVSLAFYLKPFFYETPLFFILCALGLFFFSFAGYRLRIHHLKQRERELVLLVEARTADLREEKEKTEQALVKTEEAHREAERQRQIIEDAKSVIEEQAEKLQEMDRIKTRFFNNISHEFRTPLTLNIGPLENALMGVYGPLSDEMRKRIEVMLRNSRLLLRLINQLLDVAKLESGQMQLKMQQANLVEMLEGIVLSFTAFAEKKHLTLDFQAAQPDLTLNFDPNQLEKVFFNLLSNAVKFTPEGGRIGVSIAQGANQANGVEGETVVIRFSDTGSGIPASELDYIFDRFHQVDGTISNVQEGTGIGLTLVKELIELHSGTILVQSEVGKGTEFIVTLPVRVSQADLIGAGDGAIQPAEPVSRGPMVEMAVFDDDEAVPTNGHSGPPPGSATILVVDDNPEIRDYVAGCLRNTYQLIKAVDGQDALMKVREHRPDLVVSDVVMPNMGGYELCRAIKQDTRLNHIPVILLTSRASLDEKIEGLEAGSDDYLTKPFSARELLVRVRNLLRIGEQQHELKTLNEELWHTNEELRDVSQMKSQLLRIAAHDLKNPLNGIREFAKILKYELAGTEADTELLDLIQTSSDQMLTMVSKILDSEALESGQLIMQKEVVNVCEVAEGVVRRNRPQAERKGETIIMTLDKPDVCRVEASQEWLRDAFDNLLSNAIKYSPFEKTIWVSVQRHGAYVRFSVRDEGPGLTLEDKKKLFGKFQRLSAVPTSDESSTGLGLSIVKQIVDLHGGRVWAESEHGQGSTFFIELAGADVGEAVSG